MNRGMDMFTFAASVVLAALMFSAAFAHYRASIALDVVDLKIRTEISGVLFEQNALITELNNIGHLHNQKMVVYKNAYEDAIKRIEVLEGK